MTEKEIKEIQPIKNESEGKLLIKSLQAEIDSLIEAYKVKVIEVKSIDDEKVKKASEFKIFCDSQTAELQEKTDEKNREIAELNNEVSVLVVKKEENAKAILGQADANSKLSSENTLLEQRKSLLTDEVKFLEGQVEKIKITIETKVDEQSKQEKTLNSLAKDISAKKEEFTGIKQDILDVKKEYDTDKEKHLEILKRSGVLLEREARIKEMMNYIKNKYEKIGEPWNNTDI